MYEPSRHVDSDAHHCTCIALLCLGRDVHHFTARSNVHRSILLPLFESRLSWQRCFHQDWSWRREEGVGISAALQGDCARRRGRDQKGNESNNVICSSALAADSVGQGARLDSDSRWHRARLDHDVVVQGQGKGSRIRLDNSLCLLALHLS